MPYVDGIIGITAAGKTIISHNGVQFETTDKSVIAMAQRGNTAGAAKRYIGKSSTARALRQANKKAQKPIYSNVAEALYKKVFKQKDKYQLKTDKKSLQDFRDLYRKTIKETEQYINEAVQDNVGIADYVDRIPGDLKAEVDNIITEEIEKAYSQKGQVENTDISRISVRIRDTITDYRENLKKTDPEEYKKQNKLLKNIIGAVSENIDIQGLVKV